MLCKQVCDVSSYCMGLFGVLTILLIEFNFSIKSAFRVPIFNDAFCYYKIV